MQEPVGDILEQGPLVFIWFIPVVRNYKYHTWYEVYKWKTTKFIIQHKVKWM